MKDRIRTQHPQGKQGVNLVQSKYDMLKTAILEELQGKSLTHTELADRVTNRLGSTFEGSVAWYLEAVKLDLEARRIIERDTTLRPARYRISQVA